MNKADRERVIEPTTGLGSLGLKELFEYRDLLRYQVIKEIKGKYRQMALGPLWIVIQPLMNMVVFSFVFGSVAKMDSAGVPYMLLTYCALVPWTFFQNATSLSSNCLVTEMGVISKVYFPRLILPISYVIGRLIDFAITFSILVGMLLFYGYTPDLKWLFLPFYMMLAVFTTIALSTWTASLTVRFRDMKFVVQYGLQLSMFLTPVAFLASNLPQNWLWILKLNPMYYVVEGFRWALIDVGQGPEPYMLFSIFLSVILAVTGVFVFRKTERTIVDLL